MGESVVLVTDGDSDVQATLQTVVSALGLDVRAVRIPQHRLPRRVGNDARQTHRLFTATPEALLGSWRVARHLERLTRPGDVVVMADRGGLAGIFALEQWAAPPPKRRNVILVAGHAALLTAHHVGGTHAALSADHEHQVDWEIVAFRFAERVVATSRMAVDIVGRVVHRDVELAALPEPAEGHPSNARSSFRARLAAGGPVKLWAPEPVGRDSQSPAILRAVAVLSEELDVQLTVSTLDDDDRIWAGSTWRAMSGVRRVLGRSILRGHDPEDADVIVLGRAYSQPPPTACRARSEGALVVVPADSAASARWPDAPTWRRDRDLAGMLAAWVRSDDPAPVGAGAAPSPRVAPSPAAPARTRLKSSSAVNPPRARRISVGMPIFRDVRFLDEAVSSVLQQRLTPHEVLLVDDGSRSRDVDAALNAWRDRDQRIRLLRQPNLGVCSARNLALDHMTGDAFLLLDQDDVLEPVFLSRCAGMLRGRPELWAVATWTQFVGSYNAVEAKPPFDARIGWRENPIVSTCALVDMRARDAGIRFTEDLAWIYCEDWEFWAQIVARGGEFGLVPEPLVRHRVHPHSGGHLRTGLALAIGRERVRDRLWSAHAAARLVDR